MLDSAKLKQACGLTKNRQDSLAEEECLTVRTNFLADRGLHCGGVLIHPLSHSPSRMIVFARRMCEYAPPHTHVQTTWAVI